MEAGRYKWIVLVNTTLGMLLATIDASIILIAMPDIFKGVRLDPLLPSNSFYLLWMILGYMVVTSVLVVSFGRLGDMFGRVRMYSFGFAIYTAFSFLLTVTWMHGRAGAMWLVVMRVFQGVGGAFIIANSAAILTDAFPKNQRGLALGINNIAGISGAFIGLVLGGVLGPIDWRLVFLVSVPFGLAGTLWSYFMLEEKGVRKRSPVDWAGIYMLPLTLGFLLAGPVSGYLSDHFGSRPFTTGGMLGASLSFVLLELLPVNFHYSAFAALLLLNGLSMGLFASPNRAGVMNSLPPDHRGVGSGMNSTFQNSAQVLSIGIFFSLMIAGLAAHLPSSLYNGLVRQGVPAADAARVAHLPPVSTLFAAFLGYSPMKHLLGTSVLGHLSSRHRALIIGRRFFPRLIAIPFHDGLHKAFDFSILACLVAAGASWLRGGKFVYKDDTG